MRVLVLSTWCPVPPDNGSRIRAYHLLTALASGHEVTAITFDPAGTLVGAVESSRMVGDVSVRPVGADPFRYTRLPQWLKFASPVPVSLWPIREMRLAVDAALRDGRYDAIVAFQAQVARYVLTVDGPARVIDVDTALAWQMRERYLRQAGVVARGRTWLSWRKAAAAERALFTRYQACTVSSQREVAYLQELVGPSSRVEVIPNGVDCASHRPGLAAKRPGTLIYSGALTYSANYDAMRYFTQDIFPMVRAECPDATLRITGSTSGVDIAALGMDGVTLTGYLDDVRPAVAESSVCVVPLREGGGTRLKILEAMALGTAVVSTTKGAEGLDVVDGEHLLIADDPAEFATGTVKLLRDAGLRERLSANARRLVEKHYDWAAIGGLFRQVVERAVAEKRDGRHG